MLIVYLRKLFGINNLEKLSLVHPPPINCLCSHFSNTSSATPDAIPKAEMSVVATAYTKYKLRRKNACCR